MVNAQLTNFICVADSGSFNKAAEKLFISSTAVIKQMNLLEKHLNMKLFDQTNHGSKSNYLLCWNLNPKSLQTFYGFMV